MKSLNRPFLAILAVFAILCAPAQAWEKNTANVQNTGEQVFEGAVDLSGGVSIEEVPMTASAAELNTLDGMTATKAELIAAADVSARVTSIAIATNAYTLTLAASTPVVILSGGPAQTNVITLATPYPVGSLFTLAVDATVTNKLRIADSTSVVGLGGDVELSGTDVLQLYAVATNKIWSVSLRDN